MHDLRKMIVCARQTTTNCWSRKHTLFSSPLLSLSCTTLKYALCALSSLSSLTCHFFSFFILPSFPSLLYLFLSSLLRSYLPFPFPFLPSFVLQTFFRRLTRFTHQTNANHLWALNKTFRALILHGTCGKFEN